MIDRRKARPRSKMRNRLIVEAKMRTPIIVFFIADEDGPAVSEFIAVEAEEFSALTLFVLNKNMEKLRMRRARRVFI
tara:strand:- start:3127 stop:3357 length:231 start_codon:yes stop_codon:yes gene_type:complete